MCIKTQYHVFNRWLAPYFGILSCKLSALHRPREYALHTVPTDRTFNATKYHRRGIVEGDSPRLEVFVPYVNCGHCSINRLLELPNLPMPYCSACGNIVCHTCRNTVTTSGCRHRNYASASVKLSGMPTPHSSTVSSVKMATVTVNYPSNSKTHSYPCPPGSSPPTVADVRSIWTAVVGHTYGYVAGTNGSGGGKANASNSQVFSAKAGTAGVKTYGGYDHFHVGQKTAMLGSTERVWYCVDTSTTPITVIFSAILDG